jgi:hypothetical protein
MPPQDMNLPWMKSDLAVAKKGLIGRRQNVERIMKMDRREFCKVTGAVVAAGNRVWAHVDPRSGARTVKAAITFLERTEVLICGSTLFACELALEAARAGKHTALVMERTNPFYEGIVCLRSWLDTTGPDQIPQLLKSVIQNTETSISKYGRIYFNPNRAALDIEDQLCEAGVRLYYNAPVALALGTGDSLCGVGFGGKTGLVAIESPLIIDATPNATVARAAGVHFVPLPGERHVHYVVEICKPTSPQQASYTADNGIHGQVEIHHYYAGFDLTIPKPATGAFADALDLTSIYEAVLDFTPRLPQQRFRGADAYLRTNPDLCPTEAGRVAEFGNLFVFGPLGVSENTTGQLLLKDPTALGQAFPDAVPTVRRNYTPLPRSRPLYELWNQGMPADPKAKHTFKHSLRDPGFTEPESDVAEALFTPPKVQLQSELLVAGTGTSGVAAAYQASRLGIQTLCIDKAAEVGGTNTVGGVTKLWFGNQTKAFTDFYNSLNAHNDGLNAPAFFRGLQKVDTRILLSCPLTGVATQDRRIVQVYVITPAGLAAVAAKHYIEATGDGSLAAWAGCDYTYGCERDGMTLWASFGAFEPGRPEALRQFLTPCDEQSAEDAARVILSMRRNRTPKGGHHIAPSFYLAPRETRHITGSKTVTYLDMLAGRRFSDGVFRARSNIDTKGIAISDAAKAGFIPRDRLRVFEVTVPYGAMLPRQIDNVIIAGKAYSVTHDALAMARMQRDIFVMGLAAAQAMQLAIRDRTLPRHISVAELQSLLIEQGVVKPNDIAPDDVGLETSCETLASDVARASNLTEALMPSAQLLLAGRDSAKAALAKYSHNMSSPLARLLCFLGEKKGIDFLLADLDKALAEEKLPADLYISEKGTPHLLPDHGFAPLPALIINNLARAGEKRLLPRLAILVAKLDDVADRFNALWGYTYALAYALERLAVPQGTPILKQALDKPFLKKPVVTRRHDPRRCVDIKSERLTYLRLCLSRALARCGDSEGCLELCEFLEEARVCYARNAHQELVAVTSHDFGFDAKKWKAWLADNNSALTPTPVRRKFF